MIEAIILTVCIVGGIALFVGALATAVEGPWWRRAPIPGQHWDLPSIGPVRVKDTDIFGVTFADVLGNSLRCDAKAFRWQAKLTTREAFETAVVRERVMKGGAP